MRGLSGWRPLPSATAEYVSMDDIICGNDFRESESQMREQLELKGV
jgi:hypothetical protein